MCIHSSVSRWFKKILRDKEVDAFSKGINPKVNIIAWQEFELIYYDVAVQHINHYTMGTSSRGSIKSIFYF